MRALGTRGALHLRARLLPAARIYELALVLRESQGGTGCWLVVHDRIDIALASGARAAQLSTRSLSSADARTVAPDLPLGASVHSAEEAVEAAASGADWVVAGHIFPTPSHPDQPARGEQLVRSISAATPIACIAIGGIRPEHVPQLRAAGAHGVAVIRGIWSSDDAERAATDYVSAYEGDRDPEQ